MATYAEQFKTARTTFLSAVKYPTMRTKAEEDKILSLFKALDTAKGKEAMTGAHKSAHDYIGPFIKKMTELGGSLAKDTYAGAIKTFKESMEKIATAYQKTIPN